MAHKMTVATMCALMAFLGAALTACGSDNASSTASDSDSAAASSTASSTGGSQSESPAPTTSAATASTDDPTSGSTDSSSASDVALPTCASVWKQGAKLPGSYSGCTQSSEPVTADELSCSSGQSLVRFSPHFWAVAGGVIHRAANINKDSDYLSTIARCRG